LIPHSDLESITVRWPKFYYFPTYSAVQVKHLDLRCPRIKYLELPLCGRIETVSSSSSLRRVVTQEPPNKSTGCSAKKKLSSSVRLFMYMLHTFGTFNISICTHASVTICGNALQSTS
jgi:hypothetical protein